MLEMTDQVARSIKQLDTNIQMHSDIPFPGDSYRKGNKQKYDCQVNTANRNEWNEHLDRPGCMDARS